MKILAIGDSISYGWGVDREKECFLSLLERYFLDQGKGIIIHNGGVPGDTVLDGIARMEKSLDKFQPDYVLINFGTNDGLPSLWGGEVQVSLTMFEDKLTELVSYFQAQTKAKVFLLTTTLVEEENIRKSLVLYNEVIKKIGREKEILVLDIYSILMKEENSLLGDGLHPSPLGHQLIFNNLKELF